MSIQQDVSAKRARGRRRGWLLLFLLLCLAGVATGTGIYVRRDKPARPPVLDLAGVDPAIAAAIESARADVERTPRAALAWGRLGMVLYANAFLGEAADCFLQARLLDPQQLRWPYYRALALRMSDTDATLVELRLAVALCSDGDLMPRLRFADLLLAQENLEEADEQYRQILRQTPRSSLAHLGLARLAARRNDVRTALRHLENCLTDPATQKPARHLRAELYHQLGDAAAADRERLLAAQLPPPEPPPDDFIEETKQLVAGHRAVISRGKVLLEQHRAREAAALFAQGSRDYPDSGMVWLYLARAHMELNEPRAAENALRTALKVDSQLVRAHFLLGSILLDQGQTAQAEDCFKRTVELRPDHVWGHCYLGDCLERQGKRSEAIQEYQTALRFQPLFAHAHTNLGDLLGRDGRLKEAVEHLELALRLEPNDKQVSELLRKYRR